MVRPFQPRSRMTAKVLWQRRTNITEQQPFFSICRGKSNTIRDTTNRLWEQYWNHAPVFAQTQGHRGRAVIAEPKVLHSVRFGRAQCGGSFEAKESSVFEIAKRGGTRGIATLGDHNGTHR